MVNKSLMQQRYYFSRVLNFAILWQIHSLEHIANLTREINPKNIYKWAHIVLSNSQPSVKIHLFWSSNWQITPKNDDISITTLGTNEFAHSKNTLKKDLEEERSSLYGAYHRVVCVKQRLLRRDIYGLSII